jgi:hypothetical protein
LIHSDTSLNYQSNTSFSFSSTWLQVTNGK